MVKGERLKVKEKEEDAGTVPKGTVPNEGEGTVPNRAWSKVLGAVTSSISVAQSENQTLEPMPR